MTPNKDNKAFLINLVYGFFSVGGKSSVPPQVHVSYQSIKKKSQKKTRNVFDIPYGGIFVLIFIHHQLLCISSLIVAFSYRRTNIQQDNNNSGHIIIEII